MSDEYAEASGIVTGLSEYEPEVLRLYRQRDTINVTRSQKLAAISEQTSDESTIRDTINKVTSLTAIPSQDDDDVCMFPL